MLFLRISDVGSKSGIAHDQLLLGVIKSTVSEDHCGGWYECPLAMILRRFFLAWHHQQHMGSRRETWDHKNLSRFLCQNQNINKLVEC